MRVSTSTTSVREYVRSDKLCGEVVFGLLLLLSILGSSWAQSATPERRYDGFVYNKSGVVPEQDERIVWEVFVDPLCPQCKAGWPAVVQVAERYGSSLNVIVQLFPAPFHHNSFFAARALHIAEMISALLVYPLLELIFETQEAFSNSNTKNETPTHVVSRLVSLASTLGVPPKIFEDGFNDTATDQATRTSFKARKFHGEHNYFPSHFTVLGIDLVYGCSKAVVGTPSYLVNGVSVVGANTGWAADDWAKIFDPMMNTSQGFNMTLYSLQN